MLRLLFGLAIFSSALLIFLVQPLLAKAILPIFGGSGIVWVSCVLFFQTGLLIGYGYAYLLTKFCHPRHQALIHLVILLFSLYFIPLDLIFTAVPQNAWLPTEIFKMLTVRIWLPFVILAASSPLLQHWYCDLRHTTFPYYYYAISNAGSLIGLISYPFILEVLFSLQQQAWLFGLSYLFYAILCLICLAKLYWNKNTIHVNEPPITIHFALLAKWLSLSFLSCALLLSITQFLSQNAINLPLMWIIPLALYLISFIVTFSKPKGYERNFWLPSFLIWLALTLWLFYSHHLNGYNAVIIFLALLYSSCMICHGELVRLKPNNKDLTLFYFFIALGGVLGGAFANFSGLILFTHWWDFYLPLLAVIGITITLSCIELNRRQELTQGIICLGSIASLVAFAVVIGIRIYAPSSDVISLKRNWYGLLKVAEYQFHDPSKNVRVFMHGTILHGLQFTAQERQRTPTTYYGELSGVGHAMRYLHQREPAIRSAQPQHSIQRIAAIGLGTGTVSTLANEKNHMVFYEIDKDVIQIAKNEFSFLSQSLAAIEVRLGDGRLQLQRDQNKNDLIIVDAFNGDVIPFHLITLEAMELYLSRLNPNGIVAFHISNKYFNLVPVTKALAQTVGAQHHWIYSHANPHQEVVACAWVLISFDKNLKHWLSTHAKHQVLNDDTITPILWTDNKNSLLPLFFKN